MTADRRVLAEDHGEPGIGDGDRDQRPRGDLLAEEERAEDHHEDRIGEEDQPLDLRGDIFEAEEVEIARHPIAEEADARRREHQPPARQRPAASAGARGRHERR